MAIREFTPEPESNPQRETRIRFFPPSQLRDYESDAGAVLVGDCHIMRGEVFVIGGEPGCGKSTLSTELAICGATGRNWIGLPVHFRFRTMIIQNENGRYRLREEYRARGVTEEIENSILVSEPPPFGMTLDHPDFLADVKKALESFKPDLVIFDPWNSVAKDDKAKDYSAAFDSLRAMLPKGLEKPALGIVAHTRKPKLEEKKNGGTSLMHCLAGSYVITSVPRAVFILIRGNPDDETDNSVVVFNPKNNNGAKAPRRAFEVTPAGFHQIPDFDWKDFDGASGGRKIITLDDIQSVLGDSLLEKKEAVRRLAIKAEVGERASQKALEQKGKFSSFLKFDGNLVGLKKKQANNSH
jgi:hypothetical protein